MKARFGKFVSALGASLWFVPSLLALAAAAAALGLIELDRRVEPRGSGIAGLLFHGGPEGARAVLSALASSMMTVTGVTFSVTVVALTLASQQYTPRLLRHFASDRVNQVVLGTFIGTFVYCLLVLRTVRSDAAGPFVPHLAVTGGVVLAVASLALLIFFIHHVAASIQPSNIISGIAENTHELIDQLFPERLGDGATPDEAREEGLPESLEPGGIPVPAAEGGYLQAVDVEALLDLAGEEDLLVRVERAVGDFVPRGAILATAWRQPGEREPQRQGPGDGGAELARRIRRRFAFGRDRTLQQDPEYGVVQISDIAAKALSPGINDPTTALTCLDFLGAVLRHMGARGLPSPLRKDGAGRVRVITRGTDFGRMADLALSQIRHYGETSAAVTLRLLEVLAEVAEVLPPGCRARREVLRSHLAEIAAGAERGIASAAKRAQVEQQTRRAERALEGAAPSAAGRADAGAPPEGTAG